MIMASAAKKIKKSMSNITSPETPPDWRMFKTRALKDLRETAGKPGKYYQK
jgi:hypothetical protein